MALSPGTRIGSYEIAAQIGQGGMGEVYRARDSKLGREVALKVLPEAVGADPERLARFDREARMLASLNHPHIAQIYGLEDADGVKALVMELVQGPTLDDRIAHGAIPMDEALPIVKQIVEALEAAHEQGIIHRDLKPANIKVRPDGTVKVLDFGLAKAMDTTVVGRNFSSAEAAGSKDPAYNPLSQSPTITSPAMMTGVGMILGTAVYMSPEQARGTPVDKRADIWAFGCVLYEMLTGRRTFLGATATDVIAAIIERQPDWSQLPPDTPTSITRLLHRCLEKDTRRRLRDIGDATIELDTAERTDTHADTAPVTRRGVLMWCTLALVLGAAIGGAGVWWAGARAPAPAADENLLANAKFSRFTDFPGTETVPAISPDGRFVAFLSDREGEFDLWVSQVSTGRFTNITKDVPPLAPNYVVAPIGFSADGADVWYTQGTRRVRVPLTGGTPQPFLNERSNNPSWSADGRQLVYSNSVDGDPTFVAEATGANARQIFVDEPGMHSHNHVFSTDSQWIYFVHGNDVSQQMDVWRVRPSGQDRERLTEHPAPINFLAPLDPRTVLYVAPAEDRSGPWLWTLDVERKVTRRVSTGLEQYVSVAASSDGRRVVATVANPIANLWRIPLGEGLADASDVDPFAVPTVRALAPRFNGQALFYLSARGTGDGLWRAQNGQSFEIWNGASGALSEPAAVSPDGRRVAIVLRRERKRQVAIMSADGSDLRFIADSIDALGAADWSPDGTAIVIGGRDARGPGLFKVPVDNGAPVRLVTGGATNPVWSPDGLLIVYGGPNVSGQQALMGVRPSGEAVELPEMHVTVLTQQSHRFLPNGKGLVYIDFPFNTATVTFTLVDLAAKTTRNVARFANQGEIRTFDITPDGKSIVFDRSRQNSDIVLLDLVK